MADSDKIQDLINNPDKIKSLQENPEQREAFLKQLFSPDAQLRARQLQRRLNLPYYTEVCGQELIPVLNLLISSQKTKRLMYKDFPGWKPGTIYNRIQQSFSYVIDRLDTPDKKYKLLFDLIEIRRKDSFIEFIFKRDEKISYTLIDVKEESTFEDVKSAIINFIDNGTGGTKMIIPDKDFLPFNLSAEEIQELEEDCIKFESRGILANIQTEKVTVIKAKI